MAFYNKVYIGHVETINLDVPEKTSPIESKVVALKLSGFDKIKNDLLENMEGIIK